MHDMQPEPDGRREVHNAAFDEEVASAHLCGMTDLRTGRTCTEPVHHGGSCFFVSDYDHGQGLRGGKMRI